MKKMLRNISLGFTEEAFKEGKHIIYLYNDDFERKRTMAKFLQQGLLDEEKILYLVDDISPDEMKTELRSLGVAIDEERGGFDITRGHNSYCRNDYFTPEFMLGIVGEYYENAVSEGYTGARGAGEMTWALFENQCNIADLLRYEARLNTILQEHPLTTVCQYDAGRFDGAVIMDILSVHPMMIVRGQLLKNPAYLEPEIFLKEYEERIQRNGGYQSQ